MSARASGSELAVTSKRVTHLRVYFTMVWEPDYSGEADKTEFRSSLSTETVSSLIGYHFNKRCKCELSLFDESLLAKGKSCTNERNKGYKHYYF